MWTSPLPSSAASKPVSQSRPPNAVAHCTAEPSLASRAAKTSVNPSAGSGSYEPGVAGKSLLPQAAVSPTITGRPCPSSSTS